MSSNQTSDVWPHTCIMADHIFNELIGRQREIVFSDVRSHVAPRSTRITCKTVCRRAVPSKPGRECLGKRGFPSMGRATDQNDSQRSCVHAISTTLFLHKLHHRVNVALADLLDKAMQRQLRRVALASGARPEARRHWP